jgi:hypothetical protein
MMPNPTNRNRDNTTRLSSGAYSIRRSENPFVEEISKRIATENLRKTNARDIRELEKFVLMFVNSMPEGDKMAILREYGGDIEARDINNATVETLIINLDSADLNNLIKDAKRGQQDLGKQVKDIRNNNKRRSGFNTGNFEDRYKNAMSEKT